MGTNIETAEIDSLIITDKKGGMSDVEIGKKYGITYRQLEKVIRQATGVSVSNLDVIKRIKTLSPKDFKEETTTIWSFKSRGNWATHSGEYRGNWSPYIPRNVILKYSQPDEIVLDYFCGAGTTAIEAKLLGRKCIAMDINEKSIELAQKNLDFHVPDNEGLPPHVHEPKLRVGDARDLSFLKNNSVDLICSHPPYANIIHYTENEDSDLSYLDIKYFLVEMKKVAKESYRVLRPQRQCAILIGDMRRHKHVIPLGFDLIDVFLNEGFKLKELAIKRQHNCKSSGFWYSNSIKFNFLLLAHEYLAIFEKPAKKIMEIKEEIATYQLFQPHAEKVTHKKKLDELETTTVWIFPKDRTENLLNKNVINRYYEGGAYQVIDIGSNNKNTVSMAKAKNKALLFIKSSCLDNKDVTGGAVDSYIEQIQAVVNNELAFLSNGGHCVIQTKDIRVSNFVEPTAKLIVDSIHFPNLLLKEIIVITTTESNKNILQEEMSGLQIAHQYLLVYKKKEE